MRSRISEFSIVAVCLVMCVAIPAGLRAQSVTVKEANGSLVIEQNLIEAQDFISATLELSTDEAQNVQVVITGRKLSGVSISIDGRRVILPELAEYGDASVVLNTPYLYRNASTGCLDLILDILEQDEQGDDFEAEVAFSICNPDCLNAIFYVDGVEKAQVR